MDGNLEQKFSCEGFPSDSTTSSKSGVHFHCTDKAKPPKSTKTAKIANDRDLESERSCSNIFTSSSSSSSSILTTGFKSECKLGKHVGKNAPNIGYELAVAKAIMQQYSSLSGDNLFDHLSDIIKRIIDERPPNVIDFFEEFSRNVREQKFHLPERFPPDAIYDESRLYRVAKRVLLSMKLRYNDEQQDIASAEEMSLEGVKSSKLDDINLEIDSSERLSITFNERVQQLQFYWNQCGFSICSEDIFQLACAMDRLQTHPSILQCRFWGIINGIKASYYIVEASLTREEIQTRLNQMEQEMLLKQQSKGTIATNSVAVLPSFVGPELTPGINGWENFPEEELAKMQPAADPIPLVETVEVFDIPPEAIGLGLNRFSYFVVNALSDNWIELPIVTPKQIQASRTIKKFLTGDLEAEVNSYPCFPGKEKHYLRAMISRITAGTYISPHGYYRRMTKREQRLYDGIEADEMEEEEEEEEPVMGEDDEEDLDNDVLLLRNEKYEPLSMNSLSSAANWVHVRPSILKQGRIEWYDEEKARKEREKELARLLKQQLGDEMGEEDDEEEEEADTETEGEEEELLEGFSQREIGPPLLNPCNNDVSNEFTVPWVGRFTSQFTNKNERIIVMHSNIWPGAYTFAFEKLCESVYMGWGHKYNARNEPFVHLSIVSNEFPHNAEDFIETTDPSVAEEEAYRLWLLSKEHHPDDIDEQLEEYDINDDELQESDDD